MEPVGILRLDGVYKNGYGVVPKFVMHDPDLSLVAKAIYAFFCSLAGSGEQTFPYRDTVLRHLIISKNTYYSHYNQLIQHGYITVTRPPDKSAANIYTLVSNPRKFEELRAISQGTEGMIRYRGLKSMGYGSIPRSVMTDTRLSVKAKGLYAYLCSYCGGGDSAYPRRDNMIFHLGISEPTYYKCYDQLLKLGYLTAVQRREGSRFGINDYYLNEFPGHPATPSGNPSGEIPIMPPDNADIGKQEKVNTKSTQNHSAPFKKTIVPGNHQIKTHGIMSPPYPKNRDTKKQYLNFGDINNKDVISNNSDSNNSLTIINPSTAKSTRKTAAKQSLPDIATDLMDKLRNDTNGDFGWIGSLTDIQKRNLSQEFLSEISGRTKGREIKNIPAYIKVSLFNWLTGYNLRRELSGITKTGTGFPEGAASYSIKDIEIIIDHCSYPFDKSG